jgi:hypothetical protein
VFKTVRIVTAGAMALLGNIAVFSLAWFLFCGGQRLSDVELPLGSVGDIAVDERHNIFVGMDYYGRIQMYDREGEFVRGWFIPVAPAVLRLQIGEEGTLKVAAMRRDVIYTFSPEGRLLDRTQTDVGSPHGPEQWENAWEQRRTALRDGVTYEVRWGSFWPSVVRTESGDQSRLLIVTRPVLSIIQLPFPGLWLGVVGLFWLLGELLTTQKFREKALGLPGGAPACGK